MRAKRKRKTAKAIIRIAPFAVKVRSSIGGFTLEFIGTTAKGERLEIELEFPMWWTGIIAGLLSTMVQGKQAELAGFMKKMQGGMG